MVYWMASGNNKDYVRLTSEVFRSVWGYQLSAVSSRIKQFLVRCTEIFTKKGGGISRSLKGVTEELVYSFYNLYCRQIITFLNERVRGLRIFV